ncbi:MAG: hypothetical protein E7500_04190 [Ruminococcus sp.]|nr:hypothetical protein [Ruminococcus sp.]
MKNLKKKALMAGSYVAVAALAVGGTFAYLTDSDKDTNTMPAGNVSIEQIEQERDENGNLVDFTQGKVAIPAVGPIEWADETVNVNGVDCKVFTDELSNVIDKIVTVENTGRTDAYVRTLVAIEAPDYDPNDLIHINHIEGFDEMIPLEIGGVKYVVFNFTYDKAIAPGNISAPSLMQVFLDAEATNEDVAKFGDTWDILVLSQAVQADANLSAAEMLEEAFGDVAANAADWFADMESVNATPASGATRPAGYVPEGSDVVISGLTVVDNSDDATNLRALTNVDDAKIAGDLTVTDSYLDGTYAMNVYGDNTGVLTVEDTTLKGWISWSGFTSASFTDCSFGINSEGQYKTLCVFSDTVVTNCDFEAGYALELDRNPNATITFENCTIGGVALTSVDQFTIASTGATVVIK